MKLASKVLSIVSESFIENIEKKFDSVLHGIELTYHTDMGYVHSVNYVKDEDSIEVVLVIANDNGRVYLSIEEFIEKMDSGDIEIDDSAFDLKKYKSAVNDYKKATSDKDELSDVAGTPKAILHVLGKESEANGPMQSDIRINPSYSGRGMYGKECFGIEVERYQLNSIRDEFKSLDFEPVVDNMGMSLILYWPAVTFEKLKSLDKDNYLDDFETV